MAKQQESTANWVSFYEKNTLSLKTRFESSVNKVALNAFQRALYKELCARITSFDRKVYILSAGSGVDFIAYHLKKRFGNKIVICLLDVAPECIALNERLFGDIFTYRVGDIFADDFTSIFDRPLDIIYNTGLLEHFDPAEQKTILDRTFTSLSPGSFYVTLNPNVKGKVYKSSMAVAQQKGTWDFGHEVPLQSLASFVQGGVSLAKEESVCSLSQLSFLIYRSKIVFVLLLPLILFFRYVSLPWLDRFFGRFIGYYGLLSVFSRSESI